MELGENVVVVLNTIVVVGAFVLTLVYFFWSGARVKKERQKTIRHLVDKGVELTPEMLDKIGQNISSSQGDVRRGLLFIGFALAIVGFGAFLGETQSIRAWIGVAMFPGIIGAIYMLFGLLKLR